MYIISFIAQEKNYKNACTIAQLMNKKATIDIYTKIFNIYDCCKAVEKSDNNELDLTNKETWFYYDYYTQAGVQLVINSINVIIKDVFKKSYEYLQLLDDKEIQEFNRKIKDSSIEFFDIYMNTRDKLLRYLDIEFFICDMIRLTINILNELEIYKITRQFLYSSPKYVYNLFKNTHKIRKISRNPGAISQE